MREEVEGWGVELGYKKGLGQIGRAWVGWQGDKDEKTREGCGDGRLWEEKKAPTRAQSKKVKKHKENDRFFMKLIFSYPF